MTTGTPGLTGEELAKIYGERFSGAELESRRHLWKALYEGFFARYNLRYVGARYWDYIDHHLPLTHVSVVEGLNLTGFTADRVIPRFVPYTVKDSPLKVRQSMVRAYLRVPFVWRFIGRQMFIAAHKTERGEITATRRDG